MEGHRGSAAPAMKGAPFIICSSCFKLVQLPADFAVSTKTVLKLRCGSCSTVLSYSYRDPARKKAYKPEVPVKNSVRRVRCPRCHSVLEEPGVPVYRCGGCGTTLRALAKNRTGTGSAGDAAIQVEDIDERTNNQAKRKEKKEQQRKQYMIWRVCFSLVGHSILFALSFMSGHDGGETTSKKWLNWGVTGLIAPVLLLGVLIIIQAFYIDLEDISEDRETVKRCKRVNLATISISKIVYFAIIEAPGCANVTARGIAHAMAFLIDMVGAIYLYRNHSCYELDNV